MSEETPTTDEGSDTGKGLRAQLEAALTEVKSLKSTQRDSAFKEAGIDTKTGLGKAIEQMYEGEPTTDAIKQFAADEYGWALTDPNTHSEQAPVIAQEQARLDQVGRSAGSVVDVSEGDALAKAEAEGDYATTMAIKGAQIQRMFQG